MARPRFTPTPDQRRIVKSMAAMGIPHEQIAAMIDCRSPKTLRKYFRKELDSGASEANYKVAKTLFEMATSGKVPAATIFWMKARGGFQERPAFEPSVIQPPPFIVALEKGAALR